MIMLEVNLTGRVFRDVILGFFVLASGFTIAAGDAGTVVSSRGTVTSIMDRKREPLSQGDAIFVKQRIATGKKSFVVLQFIDGATVTLLPKSAIVIENYLYDKSEQDVAILELKSGGLRIVAGDMAKSNPEGYKVRTPVALMVVRGPEFNLTLCGDQICAEDEEETQN